jgi:predicted glycosyltransferase
VFRALQLARAVLREKPKLAISHGSRAQFIAAKIIRIPSLAIFDYEHAEGIPFINPTWAITPEIISDVGIKNGIMNRIKNKKIRILKYPGIKEDVYVPYFKPDPNIISEIGLDGKDLVITIRPPATEAHYYNPRSEELFEAAINFLGPIPNTRLVLLPRNNKQKAFIQKAWSEWSANGKIIIPNHVVDGLNLIWHSDLVISGGGTMNREAASLGVPVYSIFRGRIGAVDRYLSEKGRLVLLESVDDIKTKVFLTKRALKENFEKRSNVTLNFIVNHIIAILEN